MLVTILLTILVFGILIFIHEFGHFIAARLSGVEVKEFALGFGPKLLKKKSKKSGTLYSVRAFPVGGFVSMVGEDEESESEGSFTQKSILKRTSIILAGPALNIVLGFILMFTIVFASGQKIATTIVSDFQDNSISSEYLQVGDKIIKVNKTKVHTGHELLYEITRSGYEPIDFVVERNGERILLSDVQFHTTTEEGVLFGEFDLYLLEEAPTFPNLIKQAYYRSISLVKMVYDALFDMITGRYGLEAVSGPVGISQTIGQAASDNVFTLMYLMALISINLGIFNLLPFPALDGGRFVFLMIEAIRRKPVKKDFESYVNFFGLVILMLFSVFIMFKDILKLIK